MSMTNTDVVNTIVLPGGIGTALIAFLIREGRARRRAPLDRMDAIAASAEAVTRMSIEVSSDVMDTLRDELRDMSERHDGQIKKLTREVHQARGVADQAERIATRLEHEIDGVRHHVALLVAWIDTGSAPPEPGALQWLRRWHATQINPEGE